MDQLMKLAQDAGMSKSQGETATGGLFTMLKENLSEDQFKMIQEKIPGIDGAVENYKNDDDDGTSLLSSSRDASGSGGGGMGGMLGSAMSAFGGGGAGSGSSPTDTSVTGLLATLAAKGINPAMMQKYMPQVASLVKSQCGIDITQYIGGGSSGAGGGESGGASGLMGQAMGMFGK